MYNRDFLKELDLQKNKTIYARISTLQFNESPIESIEGKVTGGSINLDGTSATRRTCNLSLVADEVNINDYYWGINTKFKLEIGVENTINPRYEKIIWFPQGIYIISSFSTSLSTGSYTISIGGKDKMCLLDGTVGGTINSSVDFGKIDEIDENGNIKTISYPIKDIIRDSVHQYGGEPFHNIIINDLEDYGLELLEYRYDVPMYLFRESNSEVYMSGTFDGDMPCWLAQSQVQTTISNEAFIYDPLVSSLTELVDSTEVYLENPKTNFNAQTYCMAKITYGQTAGYRTTELIYPGELVANVGESLTSILDKIKNMLGNFEYFYDLDGRFVFQKKKEGLSIPFSPIMESEDGITYVEGLAYATNVSYNFTGNALITAFNNSPNLTNLRNDYSVWGVRKSVTGQELPVHMRYAIDEKPTIYTNYDGHTYTTYEVAQVLPSTNPSVGLPQCLQEFNAYQIELYGEKNAPQWWDIHVWAEDYKEKTGEYPTGIMGTYGNRTCKMDLNQYFPKGSAWEATRPLFLFEVNADGTLGNIGHNPQRDGLTPASSCTAHPYSYFLKRAQNGIRSFIFDPTIPPGVSLKVEKTDWRELIYQMALDYRKHNHDDDFAYTVRQNNKWHGAYQNGLTGYEQYYIDMEGFWRDLYYPKTAYDLEVAKINQKISDINVKLNNETDAAIIESLKTRKTQHEASLEALEAKMDNYYQSGNHIYWSKTIYESPENLNFWFDFLDEGGDLSKYSCKMIGSRPKAINDKDVKSIYFRETPTIIFTSDVSKEEIKSGYRYFNATSNFESMFSISSQGKSAKDEVDNLLYNHSYCIESASITTIPIYYLEPNQRIYVHDDKTGIDGEYLVSRLTIPLTYNGTMSITATKATPSLL